MRVRVKRSARIDVLWSCVVPERPRPRRRRPERRLILRWIGARQKLARGKAGSYGQPEMTDSNVIYLDWSVTLGRR